MYNYSLTVPQAPAQSQEKIVPHPPRPTHPPETAPCHRPHASAHDVSPHAAGAPQEAARPAMRSIAVAPVGRWWPCGFAHAPRAANPAGHAEPPRSVIHLPYRARCRSRGRRAGATDTYGGSPPRGAGPFARPPRWGRRSSGWGQQARVWGDRCGAGACRHLPRLHCVLLCTAYCLCAMCYALRMCCVCTGTALALPVCDVPRSVWRIGYIRHIRRVSCGRQNVPSGDHRMPAGLSVRRGLPVPV